MRWTIAALVAGVVAMVTVTGCAPEDSAGSSGACEPARVTVEPTRAAAGDALRVQGVAFGDCNDTDAEPAPQTTASTLAPLDVTLSSADASYVLGTATPSPQGEFEDTYTIPAEAQPGTWTVAASESGSEGATLVIVESD